MDNKQSSVIKLAEDLIACASITPHDAGCQTIIADRLTAKGFQCESLPFGAVKNLWARFGKERPLFVFAGHTDVVPPGPESDWASPPFMPQIRHDYLYGRGACDMKGGLAAMIVAAENFVAANPQFKGSIAFLLTSDEEGPSVDGTKAVMQTLQNRGEIIDYCVVGEPSSEKKVGDQIRVGRRGSLHLKINIQGKQGHVAYPTKAKNPIHLCLPALHELTQTMWDEGNASFPPTTFQLTNIQSGTGAANVIPSHLDVMGNFRFSSAVTVQALQERVDAILNKHHLRFTIEWNIGAEPFLTKQGKLISTAQSVIKKITGDDVVLSTGGGTSDGRFIAPTGAEVIELGVTNTTAHQINECVSIEEIKILEKLYTELLVHLFK